MKHRMHTLVIFFLAVTVPFCAADFSVASYVPPPGVDGTDAALGEEISQKTIDLDGDKKMDGLAVAVPVIVEAAGTYYMTATLYTEENEFLLGGFTGTKYLGEGTQDVEIVFGSQPMRSSRYRGKYVLDVFLGGERELDSREYFTEQYSWKDFEELDVEIGEGITEVATRQKSTNLIEYLNINVPVVSKKSEHLNVIAYLRAQDGTIVGGLDFNADIPAGISGILCPFDGLGIGMSRQNGPYFLELRLERDGELVDISNSIRHPYSTKAYGFEEFVRGGAHFTDVDKWADSGKASPSSPDGKFTDIVIQIIFDVERPGEYSMVARLFDDTGSINIADLTVQPGYFNKGRVLSRLNFPADVIAGARVDGPYKLRYLFLYDDEGNLVDDLRDVYQTQGYSYDQFKE